MPPIKKDFTATNTPERVRRTLFRMVQCLNTDRGFRQTFGGNLISTAAYLCNRILHSILRETYPTPRSSEPGPSFTSRIRQSLGRRPGKGHCEYLANNTVTPIACETPGPDMFMELGMWFSKPLRVVRRFITVIGLH